jgi:nitroreductase
MKYNLTEIVELIKDRRTIYPENFSSRKVHKEQLELMLEAANWAPTHGHTEPWRFKVFSGPALSNLMEELAEVYKEITAVEKFVQGKYDRLLKRAEQSSFVVAICMNRHDQTKISELDEIMAVATAVQNMMLVASAYGIGTFWSTGSISAERVKQYLHLDDKDKCLGFLYVGYPEGEWPKGKRNIWLNKVEWNS